MPARPRLLDLFCGAGGCARGYQRAGFYVVGVDLVRQPYYCGDEFYLASALTFPLDGFDAVHASPPCKANTVLRHVTRSRFPPLFDPHPDLIPAVLERFAAIDVPWVVENVPGADLPDPVVLCGSMFGLRVRRHRLFASNVKLPQPECRHREQGAVVGVYGNGGPDSGRASRGGGGRRQSLRRRSGRSSRHRLDRSPACACPGDPARLHRMDRWVSARRCVVGRCFTPTHQG